TTNGEFFVQNLPQGATAILMYTQRNGTLMWQGQVTRTGDQIAIISVQVGAPWHEIASGPESVPPSTTPTTILLAEPSEVSDLRQQAATLRAKLDIAISTPQEIASSINALLRLEASEKQILTFWLEDLRSLYQQSPASEIGAAISEAQQNIDHSVSL